MGVECLQQYKDMSIEVFIEGIQKSHKGCVTACSQLYKMSILFLMQNAH